MELYRNGKRRHLEGTKGESKKLNSKSKEENNTPWKFEKREWHSKEWKREKRYLRRMFRELKKGRIDWKEYARIRKNYKTWCKEEKKKHEKEEEEKINNIRKQRHESI